jgi:hypothetical protein
LRPPYLDKVTRIEVTGARVPPFPSPPIPLHGHRSAGNHCNHAVFLVQPFVKQPLRRLTRLNASRFAYASHSTSRTISRTITATASKYPKENHGLRLRLTSYPSAVDYRIRWTLLGMTLVQAQPLPKNPLKCLPSYLVRRTRGRQYCKYA